MTNPDFRAELQRLVEAYDEHGGKWPDHHEQALFQAVKNARAALDQPVAPTDRELMDLAEEVWVPFAKSQPHPQGHPWDLVLARAVLDRWGTPANALEQPNDN